MWLINSNHRNLNLLTRIDASWLSCFCTVPFSHVTEAKLCRVRWNRVALSPLLPLELICWKALVHLCICLMWSYTYSANHHREHFLSSQQCFSQRLVGLYRGQVIGYSECERSIHFGKVHLQHILHHQTQLHYCLGSWHVLFDTGWNLN